MTPEKQEQALPTLLDVEPGGSPDTRFYYVTNRFNLLEILSAGFIGPRAMYAGKYYRDFVECCPGRVPLFTAKPGSSAARFVSEESDTAYPVALEIPVAGLLAEVPGHDMDSLRQVRPSDDRLACLAHGGLIPLTAVTAVHFRSQTELDEYLARRDQFANVVLDELPLTVSPGVLDGEGADAGAVAEWLGSLEPLQYPDEDALRGADCFAGARFMLAQSAPPERQAFDALAACLQTPQTAGGADSAVPFELFLPLQREAGKVAQADGAEVRLFRCCAAVFTDDNSRENSSSRLLLDEVRKSLDSVGLASADLEETRTTLDHIERLLMGERQFKPFTQGRGFDATKALCLALLRPDPLALLSWPADETGADAPVLMQAAALVGLRVGAKSLPVALRPQPLRALVVQLQCSGLEEAVAVVAGAGPDQLAVLETRGEEGDVRLDLLQNELVLVSATRPAPSILSLLRDADVASEPGGSVALLVSRAMKWSDCVATVVLFSRDSFSITQGKGRLHELRIVGEVKVSESVVEDAFAARLGAEPAIPQSLEKKVRRLLLGDGGANRAVDSPPE